MTHNRHLARIWLQLNLRWRLSLSLDRGDVDFLHPHHRVESALCFIAAGCECVGQHARRDLPRNPPLVFAPPALDPSFSYFFPLPLLSAFPRLPFAFPL